MKIIATFSKEEMKGIKRSYEQCHGNRVELYEINEDYGAVKIKTIGRDDDIIIATEIQSEFLAWALSKFVSIYKIIDGLFNMVKSAINDSKWFIKEKKEKQPEVVVQNNESDKDNERIIINLD